MTNNERTPPIVAAQLACRAQRIELSKLAGHVSELRYASPAAHARVAESIDVAAAALLGLDRALRDLQAAQLPMKPGAQLCNYIRAS